MQGNKIYTTNSMSLKMFHVLDIQKNGSMSFGEFMNFLKMLLSGNKLEKAEFIFKLIIKEKNDGFSLQDLADFYRMSNNDDKNDNIFESRSLVVDEEELEMAKLVFTLMGMEDFDIIEFEDFQEFLEEDQEYATLFNIFSSIAGENRVKIKIRQNIGAVSDLVDQIQRDVKGLQNMIFNQTDDKKSSNLSPLVQRNIEQLMINNRKVKQSILKLQSKRESNNILKQQPTDKSIDIKENFETPQQSIVQLKSINMQSQFVTRGNRHVKRYFINIEGKLKEMKDLLGKEFQPLEKKQVQKSKTLQKHQNQEKVFITSSNWYLANSVIHGISRAIDAIKSDKFHILQKLDFETCNSLEFSPGHSENFDKVRFKDFAPLVFQSIRKESGITDYDFQESIGSKSFEDAMFDKLKLMLSEDSTGKSGSFFFHTFDLKYLIKTIKFSEFKLLQKSLPSLQNHLSKNSDTLLTKYFGLYQINCYNRSKRVFKIYLTIMNNIFQIEDQSLIKNKYDLKGSFYKRYTSLSNIKKGHAKKEQNIIEDGIKVKVTMDQKNRYLNQIEKDSQFLAKNNIIDYSLLLGVIDIEEEEIYEQMKKLKFNNIIFTQDKKQCYLIGIIDTLTGYDFLKKNEHFFKKIFQGNQISCQPPQNYQERFVGFMNEIIEGDFNTSNFLLKGKRQQ